MWRYFDVVQNVLERHGGTVEKFVGDAVMAVFGVPVVQGGVGGEWEVAGERGEKMDVVRRGSEGGSGGGGQLEALVRAREHAIAAGGIRRQIEADALLMGPYVDARLGDFDLGREKLEPSKEICRELGIAYGLAEAHMARAMCHAPLGRSQTARRSPRSMARRTVAGCSRRGGPRRRPCGSTATRPAPGVLALRATPATYQSPVCGEFGFSRRLLARNRWRIPEHRLR